MPPTLQQGIERFASGEAQVHRGASAKFINLGNGWGFKVFSCPAKAEYSYETQKDAARFGIAPKVGEFGDTPFGYGYITEAAEYTVRKALQGYACYRDMPKYGGIRDARADNRETIRMESWIEEIMFEDTQFNELIDKAQDWGFSTRDCHCDNVAFMPDGRMVIIDWDL